MEPIMINLAESPHPRRGNRVGCRGRGTRGRKELRLRRVAQRRPHEFGMIHVDDLVGQRSGRKTGTFVWVCIQAIIISIIRRWNPSRFLCPMNPGPLWQLVRPTILGYQLPACILSTEARIQEEYDAMSEVKNCTEFGHPGNHVPLERVMNFSSD